MYTLNFYPNFVPIQELDDWFEHWSTAGDKPLVLVEYGAPFGWDWTMYRGWYNGQREFGSAAVPWEYCLAEWNAQFLGDAAYQISEREKRNLRWEAQQFRQGRGWYRWDYPCPVGDARLGRNAAGASRLHDRQLARVPHLGPVGQLALGARPLLEIARRLPAPPPGAARGLGQPAAARLQPGLH